MCFSSTCAMALKFLKPKLFEKIKEQADDWYLKQLNSLGFDTTDYRGHVSLLNKKGVVCRFTQHGSKEDIIEALKKGLPVPVGFLHKGPSSAPYGGRTLGPNCRP